jgi:DNA-directed RNA polymerase beta subunit
VYIPKKVRSDKFKTGKEEYIDREIIMDEKREITIGRLPVMVMSDLCWMSEAEKGDCEFDLGGYFLIKGAEKVSYIIIIYLHAFMFCFVFFFFQFLYILGLNCLSVIPA